jgi:exo-1,4-beta-D-glucosaminidase
VVAVAAAVLVLTPAVSGLAAPAPTRASAPPGATTASIGAAAGASGHLVNALLAQAKARMASTSDTGASDLVNLGGSGWQVASTAATSKAGAVISTPAFDASTWLPVANDDAGAPGTEVEALLQNGRCPDDPGLRVNPGGDSPDGAGYGTNMERCYGYLSGVGKDTDPLFDVPWWWRTDFTAPLGAGSTDSLVVNGVVGAAAVWVNGQRIAGPGTVTGDYTRFSFPVTGLLHRGANTLAIEMQPNDPNTMYTLDDVDWNQVPPDNNTGIQFPVQLETAGPLADGNAHLLEANTPSLSSSAITVRADLSNTAQQAGQGTFGAVIAGPDGKPVAVVSRSVNIAAGATQTITLSPAHYPGLTIAHPQVWWPYQMGAQPLYTLVTWVAQGGHVLGSTDEQFGVRTVTSALVGKSPKEPAGARVFSVNGRRFVVRGGGFSPDIFLHYSASDIAHQVVLLKNLGLNTLRLEGHIMPDNFFDQMDRAGILINAGYQCCDAWQLPYNGQGVTKADYRLLQLSALTLGEQLRNHPSVDSFQWSDNAPIPQQEKVSLAGFKQADFTDPLISSAEYNSSPVLGPSGEKEGPYDWVPPSYWYDTTHYLKGDSTRTNVGGAWGYDSEESAGDTVPTMDSLRRFMSPQELHELWADPKYNQYHANYEPGHLGYAFGTLDNFDTALAARYGQWDNLASYVEKAQVQDYEDTRAQFEAYIAHSTDGPTPSTGTIYWQVNKGWPSLLWNLYNSDGDQAGSYFGAQEANRSLHAFYSLDTNAVGVDNMTGAQQSGLSVTAKVYSLSGQVLDTLSSGPLSLASQQVNNNLGVLKVPAATTPPAKAEVYFVEVTLERGGQLIDRDVYWQSTQPDVVDWPHTDGSPHATMTSYANLQALNTLPQASVTAVAHTSRRPGPDGDNLVTTVTITNDSPGSKVAFFLRADVRRGRADGTVLSGDNELQSSTWDGNDITLWPGESQTLTVSYNSADLHGATPVISLSGWNVPLGYLAAPAPRVTGG